MEEEVKKTKSKSFLGIVFVLIFTLVIGYYVYSREFDKEDALDLSETATTTIKIGGVEFEAPADSIVEIEQVSIEDYEEIGPAPDINREIVFPADFPDEAKPIYNTALSKLKSRYKEEPYSTDVWIDFGLKWKAVNDFEGARLAWEYAKELSPTYSVIYGNLGFLYGYHLKDYEKAEENFNQAISLNPGETYLYGQFFEFYRDVMEDKDSAREIALKGKELTGQGVYFDQLLSTL